MTDVESQPGRLQLSILCLKATLKCVDDIDDWDECVAGFSISCLLYLLVPSLGIWGRVSVLVGLTGNLLAMRVLYRHIAQRLMLFLVELVWLSLLDHPVG